MEKVVGQKTKVNKAGGQKNNRMVQVPAWSMYKPSLLLWPTTFFLPKAIVEASTKKEGLSKMPMQVQGWTTSKNKNSKFLVSLLKISIGGTIAFYTKGVKGNVSTVLNYFKGKGVSSPTPSTIAFFSHPATLVRQYKKEVVLEKNKGVAKFTEGKKKTNYQNLNYAVNQHSLSYYSLLKLSNIFYISNKASFYIYLLLLKSVDVFAAPISFIYKFFEKPGEYVVENLAYNFLVEWSADLITTIPDTVDVSTYSYFSKINRNISPFILLKTSLGFTTQSESLFNIKDFIYVFPFTLGKGLGKELGSAPQGDVLSPTPFGWENPLFGTFTDPLFYTFNQLRCRRLCGEGEMNYSKEGVEKTKSEPFKNNDSLRVYTFLFLLSNSILKRLLNSTFLIFIQQLCEPDLDYINRQKKGIIFWDIWGEYLKQVAEENSINIYELTTDKEEQIKLLSKYEEIWTAFKKEKKDTLPLTPSLLVFSSATPSFFSSRPSMIAESKRSPSLFVLPKVSEAMNMGTIETIDKKTKVEEAANFYGNHAVSQVSVAKKKVSEAGILPSVTEGKRKKKKKNQRSKGSVKAIEKRRILFSDPYSPSLQSNKSSLSTFNQLRCRRLGVKEFSFNSYRALCFSLSRNAINMTIASFTEGKSPKFLWKGFKGFPVNYASKKLAQPWPHKNLVGFIWPSDRVVHRKAMPPSLKEGVILHALWPVNQTNNTMHKKKNSNFGLDSFAFTFSCFIGKIKKSGKKEGKSYTFSLFTEGEMNSGKEGVGERSEMKQNWTVSQFLSYQGKDTDLFIDLHPPKSFWSMPSLKYSFSVQQPIGSIVCQIFSGIFYKQISKNILVVGSSGLEKSLLIQAMAGETELKIITDNANRYAMVYRGVAVGIKLLRDVFEALSVHTPCIFLIEDIHAIGERRPFLIDETSANTTEGGYNKNQSMQGLLLKEKSSAMSMSREILYRSSKHLLSHYKKPYKEPRSLATNHFSFTFLFANLLTKTRNSAFKPGGAALSTQVIKKENELKYRFAATKKTNQNNNNWKPVDTDKPSFPYTFFGFSTQPSTAQLVEGVGGKTKEAVLYLPKVKKAKLNGGGRQPRSHFVTSSTSKNIYSSSLEIKTDKSQLLAPPASSPFSVLILKEEKKLKHKKLVKEMPWFGLPGEQFSLVSKYNYSIRVKVALLADLILSNLSVKLDMITDLLVIIDSVKGNRGFVVFATTHVPYILDPALRRPGRFDETICLPLISTLFTRWSNYRYNVKCLSTSLFTKYSIPLNTTFNKGITLDLFKYNLIDQLSSTASQGGHSSNQSSNELINYIYGKNSTIGGRDANLKIININKKSKEKVYLKKNSSLSMGHVEHLPWNKEGESLLYGRQITNKQLLKLKSKNYSFACKSLISFLLFVLTPSNGQFGQRSRPSVEAAKTTLLFCTSSSPKVYKKKKQSFDFSLATTENKEGFNQISANSRKKPHALKWISILKDSNIFAFCDFNSLKEPKSQNYSVYLSLFGYPLMLKIILMSLIGGKIGESFVLNSLTRNSSYHLTDSQTSLFSNTLPSLKISKFDLPSAKGGTSFLPPSYAGKAIGKVLREKGVNTLMQSIKENSFLFNFDNTWKHASSLLFSYLQKRQSSVLGRTAKNGTLFGHTAKLLNFNNKYSLMEAPNPPISNILLPSKRFENYKKTFNNQYEMANNQNTFSGSIFEKLQLHQQQRLLRRLYKYPIKEFFKSEILSTCMSWPKAKRSVGTGVEGSDPFLPPSYAGKAIGEGVRSKDNVKSTNFNNSYLTLAPLEKTNLTKLTRLSSINWCYKNLLYNRHRTYLTNQWWNGQQGEHNAETTFLSDIDWRYTFVQGSKGIGDINIDFPDSEQFYNPRNRRWFLTNGDWNYWFNIQSELKDIYNHYIYDCFSKAYKYLDQNREIIDFFAELLHQTPLYSPTGLNERELLNLYKRFFGLNIFIDKDLNGQS